MKRLFIDMEGTLAKFHEHSNCLELMHTPKFFLNLAAYNNIVKAVQRLCAAEAEIDLEVYILSSICTQDFARTKLEKTKWLRKHCIDTSRCMFPKMGVSKATYVRVTTGRPLTEHDYLLDDYNLNLEEWRAAGGTAIKFVNEFNDQGTKGPLWNGLRIRHDSTPDCIYANILNLCSLSKNTELEYIRSSEKASMAYWDSIDHTTEDYVRALLEYSIPKVKLGNEDGDEDMQVMELAKEITEFAVEHLSENAGANYPFFEEEESNDITEAEDTETLTMSERLKRRVRKELEEFKKELMKTNIENVFSKAYEITWVKEIFQIIENTMFSESELENLCNVNGSLLNVLYDVWLSVDASGTEELQDAIRDFAKKN